MSKGQKSCFDAARLGRIDAWMQRNIDQRRFTGSSVILARHGEVVHFGCAGMASHQRDLAYARDTIVRIYSMTKPIASVAFMMLLERGLLHLDAPVSRFLPEFSDMQALADGGQDVAKRVDASVPTLHQLLTHTSGMTYAFNPGPLAELYAREQIDFGPATGGLGKMCERVAKLPLAFQPGTRWEYSVGIDIIGRVIEVVSGQSLDAFIRSEILEPLGMVDTFFALPKDRLDRFADCFVKTEDDPLALQDRAEDSPFVADRVSTYSGGGGLVSTLDDYLRFGEMLRQGGTLAGVRLLSPRTVRFLRSNHLAGDIASMGPASFAEMPMDGMGFGIGGAMVLDPARARMPGSPGDFGWGGMASTFFWTDPVEELTCVFFTQLIPSSSYPNRAELKALIHGALVD